MKTEKLFFTAETQRTPTGFLVSLNPISYLLSPSRRGLAAAAVMALSAATGWGQLFTQNFSSSGTVGGYANANPNNGQFNAISSSGAGTVLSINSGKLRFARTANAGAYSRTTDFSGPPTSLIYKFDLQISGNSSATPSVAGFQVGSGFTTANGNEANAAVHSRFNINTTTTAGTFTFNDVANSQTSGNQSGSVAVTWVINNSGGTLTYKAPDGSYETVANDKFDLWAGTTRVFNDSSATTTTQSLTDLKFFINNGTLTIDIDNIVIDPIPSAPSAAPTFSSVGSSGFTVNWNAATGATGYRLDIDDNSDFSSPVSGYNNLAVAGTSQAVTGLNGSTTYYARVRTENYAGTSNHSSSGTQATTSAATVPAAPTITGITLGNGQLSVEFTAGADGGSTITDYKWSIDGTNYTTRAGTSSPIVITGLTNGTAYTVRIRAVNAAGDGAVATAGAAATPRTTPTLTSPTVTSISTNSAVLGANVTSNGGDTLTARGTVWGTAAAPTGNLLAEGGTTAGVFTHSRTGLTANTSYVYRGYAVNGAGTAYSADDSFTTLPLPPTVGTGSSATTTGFTANWSHPTMGNVAYTYTVEVDDDINFGSVNATQSSISSANTSQAITGLSPSTTYYYRVRAVNAQGSSINSATSGGITTEVAAGPILTGGTLGSALSATYPAASSGVSFTPTGTNLSADITVTAQSGYEVSTSLASGYGNSVNVPSGTTVYFRFAANRPVGDYNGAKAAELSSTGATAVDVTTSSSGNTISKGTQAAVIGSLTTNTITFGQTTTVTVSGGSGTGAYEFQQNGGSGAVSFSGSEDSRTISVTTAGTANIEVRRVGDANYNDSSWVAAATLTINKADQTITFGALANRTFGDAAFNPGATANSGLTVTYASFNTNVATVAGSTATIVGVGSTTITASQAGNANYNAASDVQQSLTVNQATQTITFNPLANVTAGTTNALTATSSFAGLTISYTSANTNVATIANLTNLVAVAPGVTTITASQAGDSNVAAATPVSQTLNVAAAGVAGQYSVDFEGASETKTGYGSGAITLSGISWNMTEALIGTTSGSDYFVGLRSARLRGYSTSSMTMQADKSNGAGTITFKYRRYGTDAQVSWKVEYSTDGGTSWTQAGSSFTAAASDTAQDFSATINVSGNVRFRIVHNSGGDTSNNKRANVDNFNVTDYPSAGAPAITPSGSFLAVSATYGTASLASASTAVVTGGSLSNDITATAPTGFEVSTNGSVWTNAVTYAQSNGFADGTLYLRLAANAAAGTYSNQVVTLTSSGASNRTVAISNSVVSPYPITVGAVATNKVYGAADPALTYTNASLLFSDTFTGSLTRTAGTNAGTYTIGQGTLTNANYDITFLTNSFTITPKALTITADNVSKAFGVTLTTPQTGSTAFGSSGLVPGESISSVTITYTDGAGNGAVAGTYTGVVVPSAPVGINTNNYSITYNAGDLTVDAAPTITLGAASLPAFATTTYGTPSSTQNFTVLGGNLTGDVTVTAPAGFQVSTNASSGFGSSLTLTPAANAVPSTTIYVQIPGTANASTNYSGNISVTSDGATTRNVSIAASTVSPKTLTIGGLSVSNRVYDASTAGTVSGTAVYVGLTNSQTFPVTDTVTWTFESKNVGTNKLLSPSASFTAPSANYTVTQPTNTFSADITQATLTLSGAAATSRAYVAGNTNVTITGTLSGVLGSDTVGFTGTGTIASANAGTNIPVTANVTLTGADVGNYTLTQPESLTVDITKATNTITFGALSNVTVGTTNALTATASSGLAVTYTSSNTNVATISGSNVIAVAPGVTTITASQAGDGNFDAATPVAQSLTVNAGPTVLAAGDIAFLTYNADAPDEFSFVTLVDLNPGTVIHFTDNGFVSATTGRTGEGFLTFTVPSGTTYTAGTVFKWTRDVSVTGTPWSSAAPNAFDFNSTADQLFAFQGSTSNWATQTSITLLAGFIQKTTWLTTGTASATTSYQPSGLAETLIVSLATENGYFANGTSTAATVTVSGTKEQLLALFDDGATKWHNNATGPLTSPTYTITITQAQSITFGALSAVTYGAAPFALTATASSGLAVTYTSSNESVATIDGSTVTIVGAGSATITASQAGDATYAAATPVARTLTVNAADLAGSDITLTPVGDGSYTASGPAGSTFTLSYSGRTANEIATSYSSASAPTAAGYYRVTATATGNYSGSNTADYFVSGPVLANDTGASSYDLRKPQDNSQFYIDMNVVLANDKRIDSSGAVQTNGLSISAVTTALSGGSGTVSFSSPYILYTPTSGAEDAFFYTVIADGVSATAKVTVVPETNADVPSFTLQFVTKGTAVFTNGNTVVSHDFLGVPDKSYALEYSTNLSSSNNWVSAGSINTGGTGSFTATLTATNTNVATPWNNSMFFRAKVNP